MLGEDIGKAQYNVVLVKKGHLADYRTVWNDKTSEKTDEEFRKNEDVDASNADEAANIAENRNPGWIAVRSDTSKY